MKNIASFSFALVAAFSSLTIGCANDSTRDDDGNGDDGSGSDTTPPPPAPKKLDATGTYRVNDTFDLAANMPADSFLNTLIAATDGANDPAEWIVDQMIGQLDPGTIHDFLVAARPAFVPALNDEIVSLAPDLVNRIKAVGQATANVYKKFGINERLTVGTGAGLDGTVTGTTVVDGVRFDVAGTATDFTFASMNIDDQTIAGLPVNLDNTAKLNIAVHTVNVPYGKVIRVALDNVVVPQIDPTAHSLTELLAHAVDCNGVGASVADGVGIGSASFWAGVCVAGMGVAADKVYDQLVAEDTIIALEISGQARAIDANADSFVDRLDFGVWNGSMTLNAAVSTVAQPATFVGTKMTTPF
ncbi:hypothetical protein BH11MYX2_BH11MYX2_20190 [soil metagenome]